MFDKTVVHNESSQKAYFYLTDNGWDRLGLKDDFNLFPRQEFVRLPSIGEKVFISDDLLVIPKFEYPNRDNAVGRIVMDKQFVEVKGVCHDGYSTTARLTITLPENAIFVDHA